MREDRKLNYIKLLEIRRTNTPKAPGVYILCWVKEGSKVAIPILDF